MMMLKEGWQLPAKRISLFNQLYALRIMKNHLTIIVMTLALASCGSCGNDKKDLNITFVFEKPITTELGKYPSYFNEVAIPFTSGCELDFLPKPISIIRLDISNKEVKTNAWYFENMGDNTVEFSKLWLEQYFKDSLADKYLTLPATKEPAIDSWFSHVKDSLYIYSEDVEVDSYRGRPVFNNTADLLSRIQASACGNVSGKVFILINPKELGGGSGGDGDQIPPDLPDSFTLELKAALMEIRDHTKDGKTRSDKVEAVWKQYFDPNAYVEATSDPNGFPDQWPQGQGKDYLKRLAALPSILDIRLTKTQLNNNTGKVSGLFVYEVHQGGSIITN
jgi:hypothetical protein